MILSSQVHPKAAIELLIDELKYEFMRFLFMITRNASSYTKRLSLFYLFNDLIQIAARDRLVQYLEHGPNLFLPQVCKQSP
jgi:hypothetical protein